MLTMPVVPELSLKLDVATRSVIHDNRDSISFSQFANIASPTMPHDYLWGPTHPHPVSTMLTEAIIMSAEF
jgi:hypothetical protein